MVEKSGQGNFMSSEADETEAQLKQLWAGKVPPLTPEQIGVAVQLWQKIKMRREREKG